MKLWNAVKSVVRTSPKKKQEVDERYVPTLAERKAFAKRITREYRKTFEKLAKE